MKYLDLTYDVEVLEEYKMILHMFTVLRSSTQIIQIVPQVKHCLTALN